MRTGGLKYPKKSIRTSCCLRPVLILLLAGLVLAGGCTEIRPEGSNSAPPPSILVDYTRSGGLTGFSDHLVVFENGQAVYSTHSGSGVTLLDEPSMQELKNLLDEADFPNLSAEYPAETAGADYYTYIIIYRDTSVMAETTAVPGQLEPVISGLDSILQFSGQ